MIKKIFLAVILLFAYTSFSMFENYKEEDNQILNKDEECEYYPNIFMALEEADYIKLLKLISEINSKVAKHDISKIKLGSRLFAILFSQYIPKDQIEYEIDEPYILKLRINKVKKAFETANNLQQLVNLSKNHKIKLSEKEYEELKNLADHVEDKLLDELADLLDLEAIKDFYQSKLLSKESIINALKKVQMQKLDIFIKATQFSSFEDNLRSYVINQLSLNIFKKEAIEFGWLIKLIDRNESWLSKEAANTIRPILNDLKNISIFMNKL